MPDQPRYRITAPTQADLVRIAWILGMWGTRLREVGDNFIIVEGKISAEIQAMANLGCTVKEVQGG